ncbi:class I SAM-dependent methyltransferase [Cohnella sp.]|uniref:class I SAM-dependent methyltransferase n=1 Tax=Cohnella sp. TaxID=1883426 RepID=UPI003564F2A4
MDYMDLLSSLGVASAHPGGFKASMKLIKQINQPGDLRILEVGCGTGKSSCYLAKKGLRVTALDQQPIMLDKARKRAEKEGIVGIEWVHGDVNSLPFKDESFDVVFAESVTIFTDIPTSLKEYHRVLKPKGRLLDREMVLFAEMPESIYKEITRYFKVDKILSMDEWLTILRETGFQCGPPVLDEFWSHEHSTDQKEIQELDVNALMNPEVAQGIMKYAQLMLAQESFFRACDFIAYKSS